MSESNLRSSAVSKVRRGFSRKQVGTKAVRLVALVLSLSGTLQAETPTSPQGPAGQAGPEGDVVEIIDQGDTGEPSNAGATSGSGDVTEVLEEEQVASGITSAPVSAVEGMPSEHYQLSGWGYERFGFNLRPAVRGPSYLSVPQDPIVSDTLLFLRFAYARGRAFQATASGYLQYTTYLHKKGEGTVAEGVSRGSYGPHIQELFLGFYGDSLDLRVGAQRIAWGRADALSPNDVVDGRDLQDPFPTESSLKHMPSPAVRVDWNPEWVKLQLILVPFFVPDRFDLYGTNWALIQPAAPAPIRGLFRQAAQLVDSSQAEPFNRLIQQTRVPGPAVVNMSAGARVSSTVSDVDLSAYYFYGFDRTPVLTVDPTFAALLQTLDFSQPVDFGPVLSAAQAGAAPLALTYRRSQHFGADLGTALGPVVVGVDAAYDTNRSFFRQDLLGFSAPAFQGTVTVEYQTGSADSVFLIEGSVLRVLGARPPPLLFVEPTTLSAATLIKVPIVGPFKAEFRALASYRPSSLIARLLLDWEVMPPLSMSIAGLWADGGVTGLGGYYRHNTGISAALRYDI